MIYAILFAWLLGGLFISFCLFYFSTDWEKLVIILIWPILLLWGIACLIWFGVAAAYEHLTKDMSKP